MHAQVIAVFARILTALGATGTDHAAWLLLKSKLGRKVVADQLGINESDLSTFDAALSDVERWNASPAETPRRAELINLASLRALQWLDPMAQKLGVVGVELPGIPTDEAHTASRVRALELVLRELIHESYRTQDALVTRLRTVFKADSIEKWQRSAAGGDVLSGMSFGDLASLFVNREEYPRYQSLLEVEQYLAMLRERRATLRTYLDGVRLVRNSLAHHKPLSVVQHALVEAYTREIFSPLSQSWREGRTTVNPDSHLQASREGLSQWVATLAEDVREVQDELAKLKDVVAGTQRDVSALEGAVVLILLAGFFVILTIGASVYDVLTSPPTLDINLDRAAEQGMRSIRGLTWAALTFGLAMVRVFLNVSVFRGGRGAKWLELLRGTQAKAAVGAWTLAGLVFLFAPIRITALDNQVNGVNGVKAQIEMQSAMLTLDEAKLDQFLGAGGDPNMKYAGNSLLHLALIGAAWKKDGTLDKDESRRERMVKKLLAAGAVVGEDERTLARQLERSSLLPKE
ncbi:MAG: hypothetical protein JNM17_25390 [Archangium sp.]|nr:hypothetical protein [Archangium sp.]